MNLNLRLQTSVPQAKSGPQMCFIWLRECLNVFLNQLPTFKNWEISNKGLAPWVLWDLPSSPGPDSHTMTTAPCQVTSASSLGVPSLSGSPLSYPTCFHVFIFYLHLCRHLSLRLLCHMRYFGRIDGVWPWEINNPERQLVILKHMKDCSRGAHVQSSQVLLPQEAGKSRRRQMLPRYSNNILNDNKPTNKGMCLPGTKRDPYPWKCGHGRKSKVWSPRSPPTSWNLWNWLFKIIFCGAMIWPLC